MFSGYSTSNYGTTIRRRQTLRTFVVLILLVLIIISSFLLISVQKNRSSKDQKDLVRLWQQDDYKGVFDQSATYLEKKPLDYFLLSIHGFASYQLGIAQINNADMIFYLDECIWSLRKALLSKERNRDGRIYYVLGKAYFSKGPDFADLAIQFLEAAQKSAYKASDLAEYLGLSYAAVKDYRASVAAFSQALIPTDENAENAPNDELLLAIARSYIELEEYDTAVSYLAHCLEKSKNFNIIVRARLLLGNIKLKEGNYSEAEKLYMSVINEGGEIADARFQLGELYFERKETTRARAEWRKARRIDPNYAPAIARLGIMN
ncbi:hypothetical protein FACS1894102_2010 [Spirochaetia bacterium]|nr:hypothetical protein FACS1894102_2010 [Spirochaetia bacterium]